MKETLSRNLALLKKGTVVNLGVGIEGIVVDFTSPNMGATSSIESGMIYSTTWPDGEEAYHASYTVHALKGKTLFRVEAQQVFDSREDWYSVLKNSTEPIIRAVLGEREP